MQLIETDLEFATVLNNMTDSEMIQEVTDTVDTVTDTETSVKCNGNIDDSIVTKITDIVVKNNIVTSHNDELNINSKNNKKSEQNNDLNTAEVAQLNGIENNVQMEEGYCENNRVSESIMKVSKVNQKDDRELSNENGVHNETIIQTESSTENIEQFNIKTTVDKDSITDTMPTTVDKEKGNDNLDCNNGATIQAEDVKQIKTKTTADMDTETESAPVGKSNGNDNLDCNDSATKQTENIDQFNTKTTADTDTIAKSISGDKEKFKVNPDFNNGITVQTEDIEQFNIKTTAAIDTVAESNSKNKEKENEKIKTSTAVDSVTESTPVYKEKKNDNLDGTIKQTEDIEQFNTDTTADVNTIAEFTSEDKQKEKNVAMDDMHSVLDSQKNHIMDDNNSNENNDATKTVDILQPKIYAIKDTDNTITEVDILTVKDSSLEDNGNSNDTITADNEYLSIKQAVDDSEDNFDKDDMAALVYSNSESEEANDHASSECESISNADDKNYENEDSRDSMEVTETAISATVTEAIPSLTDSQITTVLEDDLMDVSDTAVSATVTNVVSHSLITTVIQDDPMEVTETAVFASVIEEDNHSSITTVLIEDASGINDLYINENLPDNNVPELKDITVEVSTDVDTNCMEIDNESNMTSRSAIPEHSSKLADCNDITVGGNKYINSVNTAESKPLQEEPGFNLDMKSLNDKTEDTNHITGKVTDIHKQPDKNLHINAKEEDNNKPSALENVSDINCVLKTNKASDVVSIINKENDANQSNEKDALSQEPFCNNTNKVCSDEKIDHEDIEKEPPEGKNVTDISENSLIMNKSVFSDTSTQQVDNSNLKKKDTASTLCLANTLDILSDDEDDQVRNVKSNDTAQKPCIHLEDDDDIMLIDDDSSGKECEKIDTSDKQEKDKQSENTSCKDIDTKCKSDTASISDDKESENDRGILMSILKSKDDMDEQVSIVEDDVNKSEEKERGPLVIPNFIQSFKSDISNMTRVDLEEFCLLKIVEGLVDRNNLSEIKTKLKSMVQHVEEWRKKAMMLTKQNRDLQIVLKTVQEDQKKRTVGQITPLRITRSVGMQVFMNENAPAKRTKVQHALQNKHRPPSSSAPQKAPKSISIPVPRLVPATNNSPLKTIKSPPPQVTNNVNIPIKNVTTPQAVARTIIPQIKASEKRPHNNSVTVDLTDDEPPTKLPNVNKTPPQKFRLVPSQQLMQSTRMTTPAATNTRKVYIPISGTQNQSLVPGQTIVFKSIPPGARPRGPAPTRMATPTRVVSAMIPRHPAPLPEVCKQPRPIHWKPLPPSPELKISKVENGIVISWKIDGYQEDVFEKIASYQLFAYQETTAPPNTLHWKKIGDVKALALPMACTLTQFMAGYKYYFAVRAVDIRSRFGPFSLPGSILLMNKKTD